MESVLIKSGEEPSITLRPPTAEDGAAVHALIAACPPLEANSVYCNILQCSHFADTGMGAYRDDGTPVGFVSGYRLPADPDTLFVWQVAVAPSARGGGLAGRMLEALLRDADGRFRVRYLETTITPDNPPSWALFRGLAKRLGAGFDDAVWLRAERHFAGHAHADEHRVRIGPLANPDGP